MGNFQQRYIVRDALTADRREKLLRGEIIASQLAILLLISAPSHLWLRAIFAALAIGIITSQLLKLTIFNSRHP